VRVLVVSNMLPDERHPERGRFVRDQVRALRGRPDLEVELYEFAPGGRELIGAARALRRRYDRRADTADVRRGRAAVFDVVHAHFGLSAWPSLAVGARVRGLTVHGTDVRHPRTRAATRAALPLMTVVGAVSAELARELPGRAARRRALVLPCGVDLERFHPISRAQARVALGLDPNHAYVLFPADPARAGKRYDRALAVLATFAPAARPNLLTLGGVEPERVPLWVNAANAVLIPSDREGFGLAALEALACEVPVLATPVGIHPQALGGLAGALCAPFDVARWRAALEPHLASADPRVEGRERAEPFSAEATAARLADAWSAALQDGGGRAG
jgi:teichuronic acid biosynthesis glycosyltransferase TuaC